MIIIIVQFPSESVFAKLTNNRLLHAHLVSQILNDRYSNYNQTLGNDNKQHKRHLNDILQRNGHFPSEKGRATRVTV